MNLWVLPSVVFALATPCFAQEKTPVFAREISLVELQMPSSNGSAQMSPDGRWLVYSGSKGAVFYDFQNARLAVQSGGSPLAWSANGRVCLLRSDGDWRLCWPASGRGRVLLRQKEAPFESGVAAWAPRRERLVIATGNGRNRLWFWNGKKLARGANWGRVLKFPDWYRGEVTPSSLKWSRDERFLALQFYGHATRVEGSAQHTVVFDAGEKHLKPRWGSETGEPHWLDEKRLMFKGDDDGLGGPVDLVVADVKSRRQRVWKSDVVAWAPSARRDFVCALTSDGNLWRTGTRFPRWQLLKRGAFEHSKIGETSPALDISPHGDMVALSRPEASRTLWLFGTSPQKPWTICWKSPSSNVALVGWTQGHSLPLVEIWHGDNAPFSFAFLQRARQ